MGAIRPASPTVRVTSRISSARRAPCSSAREAMYRALSRQSSILRPCSDSSTTSSTPCRRADNNDSSTSASRPFTSTLRHIFAAEAVPNFPGMTRV